jgi:enoyl-CoA hydratase
LPTSIAHRKMVRMTTQTTSLPAEGRIDVELQGAVLTIGINRPAKLNGLSPEMVEGIARAYQRLEDEPEARCALLYAVGPNFTAGIDLARIAPRLAQGERLFPPGIVDPLNMRKPLRTKPVVVAVHGLCYTIGIELMLAADIVIAASDTRFTQIEVRRGIMTGGGPTFRMVDRAGWGNAMRWLLTGDEFDAPTAHRLGFVQEIVEPGRQYEHALALARRIASRAPLAVQATMANARLAVHEGPDAAIAAMAAAIPALLATEDAKEGVLSFVEKREASFRGR